VSGRVEVPFVGWRKTPGSRTVRCRLRSPTTRRCDAVPHGASTHFGSNRA
jgi:hypothetical protein